MNTTYKTEEFVQELIYKQILILHQILGNFIIVKK